MSTIAELIAKAYQEPKVPRVPHGASIETRLAMHLDYRVSQVMRRDALLRVAYEALTNARSALLDAAPMRTVAPDIEELDMALAAIKPPMDIEGERK